MAKMKFRQGDRVFIPAAAVALEPEMSELDLRLLIMAAGRENGEIDETEFDAIAESFGVTRAELDISVSFLRGAGVFSGGRDRKSSFAKGKAEACREKEKTPATKIPAAEMPQYSSEDVRRIFDAHAELKNLLDLCQDTLGRVFNTSEANTVLGLLEYLRLEPDYILSLLAYCAEQGKTSLRYIERMAFSLHDKGIDTPAALDDYLKRKERSDSEESYLRHLFGMGERALTAKEKAAFNRWISEWKMPKELIELAYETTVNAIREPSVPYADKILEKWKASGFKTKEDVEATKSSGRELPGRESAHSLGNFDTDDFFEAALRRSYGGGDKK